MKALIVSSKDLMVFKRWDAAFFLAIERVRLRAETLRDTFTIPQARERVLSLRPEHRTACHVLSRAQKPSIEAILQEYPYLALAMVESDLAQSIQTIEETITKDQSYLMYLRSLMSEHAPTAERIS